MVSLNGGGRQVVGKGSLPGSGRTAIGTHQGRQWTQTLRTPRVVELEYLRLDDKTIDGTILSSLLRKVRRGPLCESFGANLRAACMTAMISGPR
jgi:hypothetical protein